ncbi:hypothetical protein HDU83_008690 [Entophlyctis luteolus]|nr:hypothetical protein HDU83_008690 [Entophlyctis luteolus]
MDTVRDDDVAQAHLLQDVLSVLENMPNRNQEEIFELMSKAKELLAYSALAGLRRTLYDSAGSIAEASNSPNPDLSGNFGDVIGDINQSLIDLRAYINQFCDHEKINSIGGISNILSVLVNNGFPFLPPSAKRNHASAESTSARILLQTPTKIQPTEVIVLPKISLCTSKQTIEKNSIEVDKAPAKKKNQVIAEKKERKRPTYPGFTITPKYRKPLIPAPFSFDGRVLPHQYALPTIEITNSTKLTNVNAKIQKEQRVWWSSIDIQKAELRSKLQVDLHDLSHFVLHNRKSFKSYNSRMAKAGELMLLITNSNQLLQSVV